MRLHEEALKSLFGKLGVIPRGWSTGWEGTGASPHLWGGGTWPCLPPRLLGAAIRHTNSEAQHSPSVEVWITLLGLVR